MVGANTGVAMSHIPIWHIAMVTALQLAVRETIKAIKIMRGSLDVAFKLNKLIKCLSNA